MEGIPLTEGGEADPRRRAVLEDMKEENIPGNLREDTEDLRVRKKTCNKNNDEDDNDDHDWILKTC